MVAATENRVCNSIFEFQYIFGTGCIKPCYENFLQRTFNSPIHAFSYSVFFILWYFCPCLDNKVYSLNSIQFHGFMGIKLINGKILCLEFIAYLVEQEIWGLFVIRFLCCSRRLTLWSWTCWWGRGRAWPAALSWRAQCRAGWRRKPE